MYNQSEKADTESSNLTKIESRLNEFTKTIPSKTDSNKQINAFSPTSTYLSRLADLGLLRLVNLFVRLASETLTCKTFMDDESSRNGNKNLLEIKTGIEEVFVVIKKTMSEKLTEFESSDSSSALSVAATLMEALSGALECISFVVIVLVACVSSTQVRPVWNERMKKSKKKKESFAKYAATIELIKEIQDQLALMNAYFVWMLKDKLTSGYLTGKCDGVFGEIEATFKMSRPNEREDRTIAARFGNITASYVKSCEDMRKSFVMKLKILLKLTTSSTDWVEFVDNAAKAKF